MLACGDMDGDSIAGHLDSMAYFPIVYIPAAFVISPKLWPPHFDDWYAMRASPPAGERGVIIIAPAFNLLRQRYVGLIICPGGINSCAEGAAIVDGQPAHLSVISAERPLR